MVLRLLTRRIIENRGAFRILFSCNNIRHISSINLPEIKSNKSLCITNRNIRHFHKSTLLNELVRFNLADIGEGIKEVVIKEWYISVGDHVSQFDNICEVQSDKATVTITSRYDGIVKKLYHELDDTAYVGKPLIDIEIDGEGESTVVANVTDSDVFESVDEHATSLSNDNAVLTTPAVRRIAKENNINLKEVTGTGPNNRILKEDLLAMISKKQKVQHITEETANVSPAVKPAKKSSPVTTKESFFDRDESWDSDSTEKIVKFNPIQKAMFKSMTHAASIPQFTYCDDVNLTNIKTLVSFVPQSHVMPIFIKALSMALSEFPELNAHLDDSGDNLIIKKHHNIGVAVDSKLGLVVPKIHGVEEMSLQSVHTAYFSMVNRARDGKLGVKDNKHGTITISNIGAIGGIYTRPIILPPELVIVAFGASRYVPVSAKYTGIKPMMEEVMPLSWSADHRAVDGATLARFSNYWKSLIENPAKMNLSLH